MANDKKTTDQSNSSDKNTVDKGANSSVTDTTTVTAAPSTLQQVEKRGEVTVDEGADAHVLKEQSSDERLDDARSQALANHAAEQENMDQAGVNHGDPTTRDKASE